jgi:hypothetical protein
MGRQITDYVTPWRRFLPEKLTGPQLERKFPTFYGNRRFITAFTIALCLSLSSATAIHSMSPHITYFNIDLPIYA